MNFNILVICTFGTLMMLPEAHAITCHSCEYTVAEQGDLTYKQGDEECKYDPENSPSFDICIGSDAGCYVARGSATTNGVYVESIGRGCHDHCEDAKREFLAEDTSDYASCCYDTYCNSSSFTVPSIITTLCIVILSIVSL